MSGDLMHYLNRPHYSWDWYMPLADFNRAMTNSNPKRDRAHAIAAEVRDCRPEMQVKKFPREMKP